MTQQQRSLVLLGAIFLLAGGVGLYAWLGIYRVEEKKTLAKDQSDTLFDFKKEQVKKLEITAKGQAVTAHREGAGWTLESPIRGPGDKVTLDAIADKLAGLKQKRDIGAQTDLSPYGLTAPRVKVIATLDDGTTRELDLGGDNPYDGTLYAVRGDARVSILDGQVKASLDKGLFDLRDKTLVPFEDADVHHLDVATLKFAYGLDRASDGAWKVTAPKAMPADSQKSNQILNALRNLRATRFVTDSASDADLQRYGLAKPTATAVLTLAKDVQKTLAFSLQKEAGNDHVYAKVADQASIAEVPPAILKDLDASLADLQDKVIFAFDSAAVRGFKFTAGPETLEARRIAGPGDAGSAAETWTVASGSDAPKPAKKWKLSALTASLHDLHGASIVADVPDAKTVAEAGLTTPVKSVEILGDGNKILGKLLLGKTEENKIDVRTADSPRIYLVEGYKLSNVPATAADLLDTPPAAPDGGAGSTAQK